MKKDKFKKSGILILCLSQIIIIAVAIHNAFPSGYIFCAGDNNQIINFKDIINDLKFVWSNFSGEGGATTIYPYNIFYMILYAIKNAANLSVSSLSSIYLSIFYLLSFWLFYLSCNIYDNYFKIKNSVLLKTIISLIYTFNGYTLYVFYSGWGYNAFLYLYPFIPIIFSAIFYYFTNHENDTRKNFNNLSLIGLILFFVNIANGNLAFLVSLNILIAFLIILIYFFIFNQTIRSYLKKVLYFYIVFFLVTFWSTVPQLPILFNIIKGFNIHQMTFNNGQWIKWQAVLFPNPFFLNYDITELSKNLSIIVYLSISLIIFSFLLFILNKKNKKIFNLGLIFIMMLVLNIFLLNKGNGLLEDKLIMKIFNNSLLGSIRSFDKTLIYLPFLSSILIYICLYNLEKTKKYIIIILILSASLINSYPVLLGKIQQDYSASFKKGENFNNAYQSFIVKIPEDYFKISSNIYSEKENYKIISMPYNLMNSVGWSNYPKWKLIGIDPTTQLFSQPIIQMNSLAAYSSWNYGDLWNNQDPGGSSWILKYSGLLNTRYIIYHKDVDDKFLNQTSDKIIYYQKENLISKLNENNYFDFYKINGEFFLPHFYIPKNTIISMRNIDDLPRILSQDDYNIRSAIFFKNQNIGKNETIDRIQSFSSKPEGNKSPILEFKKINPTKYRVIIHGATDTFPLVFSETFHEGWHAYLSQFKNPWPNANPLLTEKLEGYRILDGNEEDQADETKLSNYIKNNWITTLGDGKEKTVEHYEWDNLDQKLNYMERNKIDFISKNIQGTIQNDNLPNGHFWETWFEKPINNNENHLVANGYANSWVINPEKLCSPYSPQPSPQAGEGASSCVKNPDGTYDLELIVEFWPQRLFYMGLFISGAAFLACIGYLFYNWRKAESNEKNGII